MRIQLHGLLEGEHRFSASLNPAELEMNSEQFSHPIDTELIIAQRGMNYYIKIHTSTVGHFICDRCLTGFDEPIEGDISILYTDDESLWTEGMEDELRQVPKSGEEIDLSLDIRDAVLLLIPIKNVCHDGCKGLCPQCGKNLNVETCLCSTAVTDPRWEVLKKLKF